MCVWYVSLTANLYLLGQYGHPSAAPRVVLCYSAAWHMHVCVECIHLLCIVYMILQLLPRIAQYSIQSMQLILIIVLLPVLIPVLLCYLGIGLLEDSDGGSKPWMYTCVTVCVVVHLLVPCVMEYLQWKGAGELSVGRGEGACLLCPCVYW